MFAPLPQGFPRLAELVSAMDSVAVSAPPDTSELVARLRRLYADSRATEYRDLPASAWRKLPYAYWHHPHAVLDSVEPDLVKAYWFERAPEAVAASPRRAKRWLTPLLHAYCEYFNPKEQGFLAFASQIKELLSKGDGAFADRLKELQSKLSFFDPSRVTTELAKRLMNDARSLDATLADHLLWPEFLQSPMGNAVFAAALNLEPLASNLEQRTLRLIEWSARLGVLIAKSEHRRAFADALLRPWVRRQVPAHFKSLMLDFVLKAYGDPRLPGPRQYGWREVSPDAVGMVMSWLVGDTLRGFVEILRRTADEIWRHRQKFWMAYYDAGHIDEAWLALGARAEWLARHLRSQERGLGYGTLTGGTQDQSVLLLRIGDLVFCEWSHNGALRAYQFGSGTAPLLYQSLYGAAELKTPLSLDFHDGANQNTWLAHSNSEGGTWQRKARDFIRKQTNVYLRDQEIF